VVQRYGHLPIPWLVRLHAVFSASRGKGCNVTPA
jgi:hypothetical protein